MSGVGWRVRTALKRIPYLADLYRMSREWLRGRRAARATPFGFLLAGNSEMESGQFEAEDVSFVATCLPAFDLFVDIGANIGLYTCLARSRGTHPIAVEPVRSNLRLLYRNLEANGFTDVEVFPLALGEQPGLTQLYSTGTSATLLPGFSDSSKAFGRMVPLSTLDLLLAGRLSGLRAMIKVDVEGAELPLLLGATRTLLSEPRPVWMVEVVLDGFHAHGRNPDFAKIFELFWSHGYKAYAIEGENPEVGPDDVSRWLETGRTAQRSVNYIFAAADVSIANLATAGGR